MARLTSQDLEIYKPLRIEEDATWCGANLLRKLLPAEKTVLSRSGGEYGLPYFAAREYHVEGKPLTIVLYPFGISSNSTTLLFDHYSIPRERMPVRKRVVAPVNRTVKRESITPAFTPAEAARIRRVANEYLTKVEGHTELARTVASITGLNERRISEHLAGYYELTEEEART